MKYTEANKHTWCINAEHSLCGMNDGVVKLCCMYEMQKPRDRYPIIGKSALSHQMLYGEFMEVRDWLGKGKQHPACVRCWEEEAAGRKSKRIRDNEVHFFHERKYIPGSLSKIELNLGNTCNIKCRTCDPSSSSTWMKEFHAIRYSKVEYSKWIEASDLSRHYKQYDPDSPFWDDIETQLSTIKQFDFYGGEPFMSKKMWALINTASQKGYAKDIELHYNTNGTLWPKESLECWKNFNKVSLSFSIDGIGERFEFMRHPAKWDTVIQHYRNAENMRDEFGNMSLDWCITLSSLNLYYLPETLEYFFNNVSNKTGLYLNLVHGPKYFNLQYLHPDLKPILHERLTVLKQKSWITDNAASQVDGIINFMMVDKYNEDEWANFKKYIDAHDKYRNENYYKTFPEFGELIKAK